uniref:Uncharacterized protein n=1 Tax=Arundo donax TaxID=35708 RepID=A0A0A9DCV3_ARUDO
MSTPWLRRPMIALNYMRLSERCLSMYCLNNRIFADLLQQLFHWQIRAFSIHWPRPCAADLPGRSRQFLHRTG